MNLKNKEVIERFVKLVKDLKRIIIMTVKYNEFEGLKDLGKIINEIQKCIDLEKVLLRKIPKIENFERNYNKMVKVIENGLNSELDFSNFKEILENLLDSIDEIEENTIFLINKVNNDEKNDIITKDKTNTKSNPKVFISYCWGNNEHTSFHDLWVIDFAEKLSKIEIDVIIDIWELRLGHSLTHFMEEAISNTEKVLIICNEQYANRANNRTGGVGVETSIISPDVYENSKQEKFIPIFVEKDKNNKLCAPIYLKDRLGVNISELYSKGVYIDKIHLEEVIRAIYNEPKFKKPETGKILNFEIKKELISLKEESVKENSKMTKKKIDKILNESLQEDWIIDDELGIFTYKNDVALCIERAEFDTYREFSEPWAIRHPDKNATATIYTIKYNGNIIERKTLVNVDGYRATLPMPKSINNLVVTKEQVNFAKIVNIGYRVEEYLGRSGIRIE